MTFSRAWHSVHVFPRLVQVTLTFSRAWHSVHVFPRLVQVTMKFSRAWQPIAMWWKFVLHHMPCNTYLVRKATRTRFLPPRPFDSKPRPTFTTLGNKPAHSMACEE